MYGLPSALQVACADSSIDLVDLLLQHQVNMNYHEDVVRLQILMQFVVFK